MQNIREELQHLSQEVYWRKAVQLVKLYETTEDKSVQTATDYKKWETMIKKKKVRGIGMCKDDNKKRNANETSEWTRPIRTKMGRVYILTFMDQPWKDYAEMHIFT